MSNHTHHFQDINWNTWVPREKATLLFIIRNDLILLIHKKRGLGAGKINGPGGRIEEGETPQEAAIREVEEELLVTPTGVSSCGELSFQFVDGHAIHVFVFAAEACSGNPQETEEAIPAWTPVTKIPYDCMWEADRLWLPLLLQGKNFKGQFLFEGDTLIGHNLFSNAETNLTME
ncbi:MAG: NUDIX domain-containing protein [Kiritimatiellae bacterium]|nr:NUDIX domain-containing protein [Kiritimatiellia bacterium]